MPAKKVTVCILSQNSRHNLPGCLTSIKEQDYPHKLIKTILIDNGSTDSSVGYTKESHPNIKIISNCEKRGLAVLGNQAHFLARKAGSDYLIFLSSEIIIERSWISKLIALLESKKKFAAAGSRIEYIDGRLHSLGGGMNLAGMAHFIRHDSMREDLGLAHFAPWQACAIKLPAIRKTGLFDHRFGDFLFDADLGWRLKLAGYQTMIDKNVLARIKPEHREYTQEFFQKEKNRLMMILQNYRMLSILLLFPLLLFAEIAMIIYALAWAHLWQKLKAYGWIISRLPLILYRRIGIQFKLRKIGDF